MINLLTIIKSIKQREVNKMGNNLTATSGEDKPKEYKKKLNSIFFSPSSSLPSSTLNIQKETQEDYLYNLFKNYNYKQLHNLYLEYEYLELIKENFYLNYKLPRVTINESNNVQTTQIIKFYFWYNAPRYLCV